MIQNNLFLTSFLTSLFMVLGIFTQGAQGTQAAQATEAAPTSLYSPRSAPPVKRRAAKPKLKRGQYLTSKPVDAKPVVIKPAPLPRRKDLTYFEIIKDKNQFILKFRAQDPNLYLSHKTPIVIALVPDRPVIVVPATIITKDWPQNSDQIVISASGGKPKHKYRIRGKASYFYCHRKTNKCTKAFTGIFYSYIP